MCSNHLWFNTQCKKHRVIPKYMKITSHNTSEEATKAVQKALFFWIDEECRKWYRRRDNLALHLKVIHTRLTHILHPIEFDMIDVEIRSSIQELIHTRFLNQRKKLNNLLMNKKEKHTNQSTTQKPIRSEDQPTFYTRVMNLSKTNFSQEENKMLEKGLKYNPHLPTKQKDLDELVVRLEIATNTIGDVTEQKRIKHNITKTIRNRIQMNKPNKDTNSDWKIIKSLKTKIEQEELIICKADKGNTITIMEREDYHKKTLEVIEKSDCVVLNKDPTSEYQNQVVTKLKECKTVFSDSDKYKLKCMNPRPPQLFTLPKLHKPDCPMRPIVSYINAPAYKICKRLNTILPKALNFKPKYSVKNSIEFVNKVKNVTIQSNYKLVSFDVQSLFTSIPIDELKSILVDNFNQNDSINNNEKLEMLQVINLCLEQNYFKYNESYFKMNSGLPMGSPLSPLFANIYMNHIETSILENNKNNKHIKFWCRYVDDILCIWDGTNRQLESFLKQINSINEKIKFTIEKENNNQINFLDVTIIKQKDHLKFKIYRKPTFTDSVVPNDSCQSLSIKMSTYHSMVHRLLSIPQEPIEFEKELNVIKIIATNNGYNEKTIDNILKKKTKRLLLKKIYCNVNDVLNSCWRSLNYIPGITHKISNNFLKQNVNLTISNSVNLGKLLTNNKDKLNKENRTGVYEIKCDNCNVIYIGQCGRNFKIRIKEHRKSIEKQQKSTGFSAHCIESGHTYNEEFKILHISDKGLKLNYLENLEIRKAVNSKKMIVNEQVDVSNSPLLNMFPI